MVALARILGPAILKMVERMAKTITTMRESLYWRNALRSCRRVPLKSLARSVVCFPGLGISLILLSGVQVLQVELLLAQLAPGDLLIFRQVAMSCA